MISFHERGRQLVENPDLGGSESWAKGEAMQGVQVLLQENKLTLSSVSLTDNLIRLHPDLSRDLKAILMHALTNCIDHGFILPKRRRHFDRSEVALAFSLIEEQVIVTLTVADNGAGLHKATLNKIATQADHSLRLARLNDLLFQPGVSTAEQVTTTSGRGVSLSAIKAMAERWGGEGAFIPMRVRMISIR